MWGPNSHSHSDFGICHESALYKILAQRMRNNEKRLKLILLVSRIIGTTSTIAAKIFSVLNFRYYIVDGNSSQLCKCCIAVGNTEMKISFFPIRHYCGLQLQELSSISEPIKSHSVTLLGPFLDTFFTLRRSGSF